MWVGIDSAGYVVYGLGEYTCHIIIEGFGLMCLCCGVLKIEQHCFYACVTLKTSGK